MTTDALEHILAGEPKYRRSQIREAKYRSLVSSWSEATALPPALCAAALAALDIIREQPQRRRLVLSLAEKLRADLHAAGLDTGDSKSQILPVRIGSAGRAAAVSRRLLEAGFLVRPVAMRPRPRQSR